MREAMNRGLAHFVQLGIALFVLVWLNAGVFSYVSAAIPDALKLGAFVLWLLLAGRRKGYWQQLVVGLWPLLLFHLFAASAALFEDNIQLSLLLRSLLYLYAVFSIFLFYVEPQFSAERRVIVYVLLADYVYVAVNTALQLQVNPLVARYLSAQSHVQEALLGTELPRAIGNYAYFYSLIIVVAVLFYQGLGRGHRGLPSVLVAAAAGLLIINAQFTIAIGLLLVLAVAVLILRLSSRETGAVVVTSALSAAMLGISYLPAMFRWLAGLADLPREVSVRLLEVAYAMSGSGGAVGDFGLRLAYYADSVDAFRSSIVFGTFGGAEVGRHSTVIDMLGMFGLFALLLFWFFVRAFRHIGLRFTGKDRTFVGMLWTYILILGVLNTVMFSPIFIALFVLAPFMLLMGDKAHAQLGGADEGHVGYERASGSGV